MQLLVNAQAQNGLGVGRIAGAGGAAVRAIAKLDDAVAALVRGARVHAVALHQGHAGEVVGVETVVFGQFQDLVAHIAFFVGRYKTLADGPVEGLVEHLVAGQRRVVFNGLRRAGGTGSLKAFQGGRCRCGPVGHGDHRPCPAGFDFRRQAAHIDVLAGENPVGVADLVGTGDLLDHAHGLRAGELHTTGQRLLLDDAAERVAGSHGAGGRWRAGLDQAGQQQRGRAGLLFLVQGHGQRLGQAHLIEGLAKTQRARRCRSTRRQAPLRADAHPLLGCGRCRLTDTRADFVIGSHVNLLGRHWPMRQNLRVLPAAGPA